MFSQFEHIRERMEQARRRVIGAPGSPASRSPFMEPAVDVYETDDAVVIVAEIAGIGQRRNRAGSRGPYPASSAGSENPREPAQNAITSQMEIGHGPFRRELLLPAEVNPDAASTVYKDGMLEISLPKASPARSTGAPKIPVR